MSAMADIRVSILFANVKIFDKKFENWIFELPSFGMKKRRTQRIEYVFFRILQSLTQNRNISLIFLTVFRKPA